MRRLVRRSVSRLSAPRRCSVPRSVPCSSVAPPPGGLIARARAAGRQGERPAGDGELAEKAPPGQPLHRVHRPLPSHRIAPQRRLPAPRGPHHGADHRRCGTRRSAPECASLRRTARPRAPPRGRASRRTTAYGNDTMPFGNANMAERYLSRRRSDRTIDSAGMGIGRRLGRAGVPGTAPFARSSAGAGKDRTPPAVALDTLWYRYHIVGVGQGYEPDR